MQQLNEFLYSNAPLATVLGFLLFLGKDFARDWLARDSAAKLADNDPGNDGIARLEQSAAQVIDKIPGSLPLKR